MLILIKKAVMLFFLSYRKTKLCKNMKYLPNIFKIKVILWYNYNRT